MLTESVINVGILSKGMEYCHQKLLPRSNFNLGTPNYTLWEGRNFFHGQKMQERTQIQTPQRKIPGKKLIQNRFVLQRFI
jgi:hypothetical protein